MITAIVSKKGGVGKTTTAVNLAAALAVRGLRVLVIDLDPNASASLSLGVERARFAPGAADLLCGRPLAETVRATVHGLDLVPATIDLATAEADLDRLARKEEALRRALEGDARRYDHVLIDCPSSLGVLSRNALVAADGYLVPSVPHFLALEGLEKLVEAVDRLRYRCHSETRLLGILPTLADYRAKTTRESVVALRRRFGERVFAIEIRVNISLAEAPAYGQTIFAYDARSTGAHAYALLAEEFLMCCAQPPAAPVSSASAGG